MANQIFDVVVVGSGPAGSAAAFDLASAGARVVVLEREQLPRYKTCGGGVLARAVERLPGRVALEPSRLCRAVEFRLLDDGLRFVVERHEPLVTMTMRSEFDLALLETARQAGAEVRDACSFVDLHEESSRVRVGTSAGPLWAACVVAADGVTGSVARHAGWHRPPLCIPALECEMQVDTEVFAAFSGTARFDIGAPHNGYGWVFPKRDHLSAGILCMQRGRVGLKLLLERYLERIGVTPTGRMDLHGLTIPVRPRPEGPARGRVLLAGDSAGLADPVTAEGISNAIRSGQLAAEAYLHGSPEPARVRRTYCSRLSAEILGELRAGRVLARVLYHHPRLRSWLFRRFGQLLCEALAEVTRGRRSYRQLLSDPRNYVRLMRRWAV